MTGQVPHGGGTRIAANSGEYETIRAWIADGMPFGSADDPAVKRFASSRAAHPCAARPSAIARDGSLQRWPGSRCDRLCQVSVEQRGPGECADRAARAGRQCARRGRDHGRVYECRGYFPPRRAARQRIEHYPQVPENNFIDRLVFRKLRTLNILPSELADDAEYLRRVYLDVLGTLPTTGEARRFLNDKRPDRRARLVEELLRRPEFADFWALQWADLLRVDRAALGPKRAYAYYKWIHDNLAANRPFDEFARALVTAGGPLREAVAGQLLQGRYQTWSGRQHARSSFSRHAHRLRRMPSSSLRPLEPGRLLRHDGVLHGWRRSRAKSTHRLWRLSRDIRSERRCRRRSSQAIGGRNSPTG